MGDLRSTLWFMVQQHLPKGQIHNISVSIPKKLSEPSKKSNMRVMMRHGWKKNSSRLQYQLPSFFNRAIVFGTYVFKSPEECLEFHWGRSRKFCIEVKHSQLPFQKLGLPLLFRPPSCAPRFNLLKKGQFKTVSEEENIKPGWLEEKNVRWRMAGRSSSNISKKTQKKHKKNLANSCVTPFVVLGGKSPQDPPQNSRWWLEEEKIR